MAGSYRLAFASSGAATISDPQGRPWAELLPAFSVDGLDARDLTTDLAAPSVEQQASACTISIGAQSSRWRSKTLVFRCADDTVEIRGHVEGSGEIADCWLVGGWFGRTDGRDVQARKAPEAWRSSRAFFTGVFSPEPSAPPQAFASPISAIRLRCT